MYIFTRIANNAEHRQLISLETFENASKKLGSFMGSTPLKRAYCALNMGTPSYGWRRQGWRSWRFHPAGFRVRTIRATAGKGARAAGWFPQVNGNY